MANEFKIKKGLIVTGASGGTVVDIQGSQGQLFSVTDDLSGSIFAVSDISGVPILDVNSSGEVNIDGTLTCSGNITGLRLRAGDGTNGHFYSDIPGRTAFAAGQFYIQDTVGTYYNYATNQYHGASSGNNHYFRGNNLTGYNWNITAAGAATFAGTIIATQNGGDASIYINNSRPSIAFTDSNSYADANDKYIVRGTGSDRLQFQWYDDSASTTTETFHINSSGDAAFAGNIKINGGVDAGSQLSLFADSNGYTSLAGYTFEINTGNNDARTRSFYIDNNKNATFAGDVTAPTFLGDLNGTINTATTGVTQTAGDDSTKIATTAYADAAAAAVPIGDYLPLAGGSLTGGLTGTTANFVGTIRSTLASDNSYYSSFSNNGSLVLDTAGVNSGMQFKILGSTKLTMLNSGNVGIGTTSPNSSLQVGLGTTNQQSSVASIGTSVDGLTSVLSLVNQGGNDTDGNGVSLDFHNDANWSSTGRISVIHPTATTGESTNSSMQFSTYGTVGSTTTFEPRMTIDYQGNVGIGTTIPVSQLEVGDSESGGSGVTISSLYSSSNAYLNFRTGHPNNDLVWNTANIGATDDGNYNGQLNFRTSTSGRATPTTKMVIKATGNVGIGITNPDTKLHVANQGQGEFAGANSSAGGGSHLMLKDEGSTSRTLMSGPSVVFQTPANADGTNVWATSRLLGSPAAAGSARGTFSIQVRDQYDPLNDGTSWNWRTALTAINSGNVGIGTTSPDRALEVEGDIRANGHIRAYQSNSSSYYAEIAANSGWGYLQTTASNFYINKPIRVASGQIGSYNEDLQLKTGATERVRISNTTGNVGIGTTSPGSKLEISSTSDALLELNGGATANPYMMWSQAGVRRSYIQHVDSEDNLSLASEYGGMRFLTGTGGTETEKMRILANGNVGIGITSPTDMLDVNGTSLFRRDLTIYHKGNNSAPSYELRFEGTNSSGVDKVHASLESSPYATDTNAGTLLFKTANASNQILDTRMVIDGVGNVGIGTTNPGARLDVKDGSSAMRFQEYSNGASLFLDGADGDFIGGDYFNISAYGATDLAFGYGALTKMVMKSTGNVGIGTTSPSARIHADYSGLAGKFVSSQATGLEVQGGGNGQPIARFKDTSAAEKVTISSTGNVGIGNTSPADELDVVGISRFTHSSSTSYRGAIETVVDNAYPTWDIGWLHARTGSSTYGNVARFNDQSGFQIGAITYNGSAGVSYATTSDYRLKENIEEISDSISRVKKLKPCRFNFTTEKNRVVDGFIAHEVQEVVPEAVHGEKDALQEDGSIDTQTLEVSRLIPVLTKALQEAIAKIEELELRIQTLENK